VDRELRIISWNRRSEEITGIKKEQAIGKKIFDLFPKLKEDEIIRKAYEDSIAGNHVHLPPKKSIYSSGIYERFFIPLKNSEGSIMAVVNILLDVSALVHKEDELKELNKTLKQKNKELEQKNEEITSFAFVASHDLREPLRKIHTFSDWLLQKEGDNLSLRGKEYILRMNGSVRKLNMLIDDIMVITRIHSENVKLQEVNLEHVFEQVTKDLASFIQQKDARIEINNLPVIHADANQLFYLFRNLVDNALKFQPPDHQPVIQVSSEVIEAKMEEQPLLKEDKEYIKLSTRDNGVGFDPRFRKKIFQVFQQLKDGQHYSGTGMGLAICKKIMENHEGLITADSVPGEGSVFCCYFPL
jgi:PAS domain S-box-containing protein